VIEVEVLDIRLGDDDIARLLDQAQHDVVKTNISLDQARRNLEAAIERERIVQAQDEATHTTERMRLELQKMLLTDQLDLAIAQFESELAKIGKETDQRKAQEALADITHQARLTRQKSEADQKLALEQAEQELSVALLNEETKAAVARFQAAKDGLYEVLVSLGRDEMATKLAQAVSIERYLSGDSISSSISNLLSCAPMLQQFFEKAEGIQSNGSNRLRETTTGN
jgi:hypothetical protein